jgi:hypothetical protein
VEVKIHGHIRPFEKEGREDGRKEGRKDIKEGGKDIKEGRKKLYNKESCIIRKGRTFECDGGRGIFKSQHYHPLNRVVDVQLARLLQCVCRGGGGREREREKETEETRLVNNGVLFMGMRGGGGG